MSVPSSKKICIRICDLHQPSGAVQSSGLGIIPMLSTSPKKSAGTHMKKRDRDRVDATTVVAEPMNAGEPAADDVPRKKRRKEGVAKQQEHGQKPWTWTAFAESSISALPPLFTPDSRLVRQDFI